jgi:UDP-GlcNAc:undecaprenyl-phosphate GlcNAc-1-phosphate transferase
MYVNDIGWVAGVSFVVTAASSPFVLQLLRIGQVMDIPSDRSSHIVATPRGGGIACLLGLLAAVALTPGFAAHSKFLLLICGSAFAVIGFADDVGHLSVGVRLGAQIVVSVAASCWESNISWELSVSAIAPALVGATWLISYVNAFNFMDGMNGLAGAATVVAGLTFVLVGVHSDDETLALGGAAAVGVALAFLPWNFPRARFFLGDVGSYLLGSVTALLVIVGVHKHISLGALLGPEEIFLADTGWTLIKRVVRGQNWTSAHRTHVYQKLQRSGMSHSATTTLVTVATAVTSSLGFLSLIGSLWVSVLGDVTSLALVIAYLNSPRLIHYLPKKHLA